MADVDLGPRLIRATLPQLRTIRVTTPAVTTLAPPPPRTIRAAVPQLHVQRETVPTQGTQLLLLARGPRGAAGVAGGTRYVHHQTTPAATWTIPHNFGTYPTVVLFLDSSPTEPVYTDVTYPDDNTVVAEWPTAETGWAYAQ